MGGVVELNNGMPAQALNRALAPNGRLQCAEALEARTCEVVDTFLQTHPDVLLRIYQRLGSGPLLDLRFLEHIASLRKLSIEANAGELNDLSPLTSVPSEVVDLVVDTLAPFSDKAKDKIKQNTEVLKKFLALRSLSFCGRLAGLAFLQDLPELRRLQLWRCRLKNLSGIEGLTGLEALQLVASGANDLAPLGQLQGLRSLALRDQRNILTLAPITDLGRLQQLWVISCGSQLRVPSLHRLTELRVVVVDKLTSSDALRQIATATGLRCLVLSGSPELASINALAPLADHPSLREVRLETHDQQILRGISEHYGWQTRYCNFPADEYLDQTG